MDYWQTQDQTPLYKDLLWNKPEQKTLAGKLAIIGGNQLSFNAAAQNFAFAGKFGAGEVKALLPDALKKTLPVAAGVAFAPSNQSGGFDKSAKPELLALGAWADTTVLVGDLGKNSDTAVVVEEFIGQQTGKLVVTRDSIDLVAHLPSLLLERPNTALLLSFAQLQKLFRNSYYPKILTFSLPLNAAVEALHKFTITYPVCVGTLHQDNFIAAYDGQVMTTELKNTKYNQLSIWNGEVAVKLALYEVWNPNQWLAAAATSVLA
jgi:hypothetical protein